jgi:hypothetical protein
MLLQCTDIVLVSAGKIDGNRTSARPRHRWEDHIKIHLQEKGWEGTDWIDHAWDMGK